MKQRTLWRLATLVLAFSLVDTAGAISFNGAFLDDLVIYRPFLDDLVIYNTSLWRKSDNYSNGGVFNCGFTKKNITHSGGVMMLELNDNPASGTDYSCAEYQTKADFGYGKYIARIKAARGNGVVTGFFVYHGPTGTVNHDEIDFEFLGKEPGKVQLNYFVSGVGGHEEDIELGFDASQDYHTYTIDWRDYGILWFVDETLVHSTSMSWGGPIPPLPNTPGKIIVNLWNGIGVTGWLNEFSYPGIPIHAWVDMIQAQPSQGFIPSIAPGNAGRRPSTRRSPGNSTGGTAD